TYGNHVAGFNQHGSDIGGAAVHFDGTVVYQLTRFSASGAEAHAVYNVVEAAFQQLNQGLACVATATLSFSKVFSELLFQNAIHALEFLLFTELNTVIGCACTRSTAMLAGLGFELALRIERTASALQKEIGTLATREFAFRSNITCQDASP